MIASASATTGSYHRMLFKAALLTAPLIGAFSILPMTLLLGTIAPPEALANITIFRVLGAISMLTVSTFILWGINIGLYHWVAQTQRPGYCGLARPASHCRAR